MKSYIWLIETDTLRRKSFNETEFPPYAMLSHTHGEEELTFQDWTDFDLLRASHLENKAGFAKIKAACREATKLKIDYIWIDTICIDKCTEYEVENSIWSMFSWYRGSKICFVHLADVQDPDNIAGNLSSTKSGIIGDWDRNIEYVTEPDVESTRFIESFRKSKWFTRGWTLQELIGPANIHFFTQDWKMIAMRPLEPDRWPSYHRKSSKAGQESLMQLVSDITGIRIDALISDYHTFPTYEFKNFSVGEKMSWAAGRQTTVDEDIVYCLMGLFDIKMPVKYGEGKVAAFKRLQESMGLLFRFPDNSLLAWQWPEDSSKIKGSPHLFALSPDLFRNFNAITLGHDPQPQWKWKTPENKELNAQILPQTNWDTKGLQINLELIPTLYPKFFFGVLNVFSKHGHYDPELEVSYERELSCIPLKKDGDFFHRAPFPPALILIRTARVRKIYTIEIAREKPDFKPSYRPEYAFVLLFPDVLINAGLEMKLKKRIGAATLSLRKSAITIRPGVLDDGNPAGSVISIERKGISRVQLYLAIRMVHGVLETAAMLFPVFASPEAMESYGVKFHPPGIRWDRCGDYSVVVSEGHRIEALEGEEVSSTVFTVQLFNKEDADKLVPEEDTESEETRAGDSDSDDDLESSSEGNKE